MLLCVVPAFWHPLDIYVPREIRRDVNPFSLCDGFRTHENDLWQQRLDLRLVANNCNVSKKHSHVRAALQLPWHRSPSVLSAIGNNVTFPMREHNRHRRRIQVQQQRFLALLQALPVKMLRPLPTNARLEHYINVNLTIARAFSGVKNRPGNE